VQQPRRLAFSLAIVKIQSFVSLVVGVVGWLASRPILGHRGPRRSNSGGMTAVVGASARSADGLTTSAQVSHDPVSRSVRE
jgi:hypothetical protein